MTLTRVTQGTGIHLDAWSSLLKSAGDELRFFNVPLAGVMGRFVGLTTNMQDMSKQASSFWNNMQPGEMLSVMEGIVSAWKSVTPQMYLGLKPGAAPMTMPELAGGIKDFYSKDPVEVMKMMADRYMGLMTSQGMDTDTAQMMAAQMPGFSEFGRMAPLMVEALHGFTTEQLQQSGASKDMSVLFDEMVRKFPDQKDNLEALRESQIILKEPMAVIARILMRIFRLMTLGGAGAIGKTLEKMANSMSKEDELSLIKELSGVKSSDTGHAFKMGRL